MFTNFPLPHFSPLEVFVFLPWYHHSLFSRLGFTPAILWLESNIYVISSRSSDKGFYPSPPRPDCVSAAHFSQPFLLSRLMSFWRAPIPSPPPSSPLFTHLASQPQGNTCCPQKLRPDPLCSSRTKQITAFSLMCTPDALCYNIPYTIYVYII